MSQIGPSNIPLEEYIAVDEINCAELPKERMDGLINQTNLLIQFSREVNPELLQLSQEEAYQYLLTRIGIDPTVVFPETKKILRACEKMAENIQIIRKYSEQAETNPKKFLQDAIDVLSPLINEVKLTVSPNGFLFEVDDEDMKRIVPDSPRGLNIGFSKIPELNHSICIVNTKKGNADTAKHEQMHTLHHAIDKKLAYTTLKEEQTINEEPEIQAMESYTVWIDREQKRALFTMHSETVAYSTASPPRIFGSLNAFGVFNYEGALKLIMNAMHKSKLSYKNKKYLCEKMKESFRVFKREFEFYQAALQNLFRYSALGHEQIVSLVLITPPLQLKEVAIKYIDFNLEENQLYLDAKNRFIEESRQWNIKNPQESVASTPEELLSFGQETWHSMQKEIGKLTFLEHVTSLTFKVRGLLRKLLRS